MFTFPRERLNEARKVLDLKYPVSVKITSGRKTRTGSWRFKENRHYITVSKMQSLNEINKTLWHELQHAADYENYLSHDFPKKVAPVMYRSFVTERSARNAEKKYAHFWLAVPSGVRIQAIHF